MAIRVEFAGASIIRPGSYTNTSIASGSVSSPSLGVVALIGEAEAGIPFASESGLNAVTYGPDEFGAIQEKFGSGELVDMAKLAIAPSNDPQIRGGAQELLLLKTNASTKAQILVKQGANTYGTLKDKKSGADGNNIAYECEIVSGQAILTISHIGKGVSEVSQPLGGNAVLTIQCTDGSPSAATVSVSATKLTTAITGGTSAQNLDISLANFASISQLADFISAQPGYSASAASAAVGNLPPSVLDRVSAQDIKGVDYDILKDAYEVQQFFASSGLVDFTPSIYVGIPSTQARAFLSGGARGATSQAAIQSALDALLKRRVNFIVPLFSRDAADDIADSLTDASSSYDIESIHAAVRSHCNEASTVKGRKERQAAVGFKGSYADSAEAAANLNSARVSMCIQDVDVLTPSGVETKQPHALAVLAMAMKASAPIGLANTFKSPAILGFSHADFDPETQGDKALADNITVVERAPDGGFRFILDNSTYASQKDAWIYNRPSVLFAADLAAYVVRINTEVFVGQRNSDVSEESIKNALVSIFDSLRSSGVIVADEANGGKGYKDLKVKIEGSIIRIDVTLTLVENYEFVLSDLRVQRAG